MSVKKLWPDALMLEPIKGQCQQLFKAPGDIKPEELQETLEWG